MKSIIRKWWLPAVIVCVALAAATTAVLYWLTRPVRYVSLDVNPGVEIQADRRDRVVSVRAANGDAEALLQGLRLEGLPLDEAVEDVVEKMAETGYLAREMENEVLLTVSGGSRPEETMEKLNQSIGTLLQGLRVQAAVRTQQVPVTEEMLKQAHAYDMSAGKYAVACRIAAEDESLTLEELAQVRVADLMIYARDNQIPLGVVMERYADVLEDSWEHSTTAASESAVPQSGTTATTTGTATTAPPIHADYCEHCGKLERECRDRCGIRGDNYCDDCGKPVGECVCIDDDDDNDYCEHCGKLERECRDRCGIRGDNYCDDCGKPVGECVCIDD